MLNIPGHKRNADITGGSKMVTRAQKQTAWAPWIKNPAEMLELTWCKQSTKENQTLTPWTPSW
jgi:hypothetical protein